jgi:hypothetical protein
MLQYAWLQLIVQLDYFALVEPTAPPLLLEVLRLRVFRDRFLYFVAIILMKEIII